MPELVVHIRLALSLGRTGRRDEYCFRGWPRRRRGSGAGDGLGREADPGREERTSVKSVFDRAHASGRRSIPELCRTGQQFTHTCTTPCSLTLRCSRASWGGETSTTPRYLETSDTRIASTQRIQSYQGGDCTKQHLSTASLYAIDWIRAVSQAYTTPYTLLLSILN